MPRHPAVRNAGTLAVLGALVAIGAMIVRRASPIRVSGPSMSPTLRPGDLVATSPAPVTVARGDVVVVRMDDGFEVIKRAVAVSGDRYRGEHVPAGHVFLAGDNPAASTDSRDHGPVPLEHVAAVARAVYWPPPRWRIL